MHELRLYFNVNEWKAEEPELLRAISGINEKIILKSILSLL